MGKFLRILLGIGLVLVRVGEARAQLDNRAFAFPIWDRSWHWEGTRVVEKDSITKKDIVYSEDALVLNREYQEAKQNDLKIRVDAFTFFKDNEYFNKIADGYTLFGTQLNPQLVYYPSQNLRLEAGVFLWKDFGNPQLQQVRPTFRATWTVKNNQFVLGNIRPHLNHGYIEPLFNFERAIVRPLEEGLQYRHLGNRLLTDVWVDWQRQQYRYSNYQEEIAGGVSSSFRVVNKGVWQVSVPFQFTATHQGGQIDTLSKPLLTLFNEATGIEARRSLKGSRVQALRLSAYVAGFQNNALTHGQLPFLYGRGLYLNTSLQTRYGEAMLSYWQGQRFIAPLGGDLYQSLSRTVSDPTYSETNRRILLLRLLRDFRISDAAALTVRLEPVYDFQARLLDFSLGIYLNFRQEWLLGNVGSRVRAAP